jgi:hypothetical protein
MQAPESAMFHRHLVLAYAFTWILQLTYLAYVVTKHLRTASSISGQTRHNQRNTR